MSGIIFGGTVTPSRLSPNLFKNPNFAVIQGTASGTLANSTALPTASLGYLGETEWCIAASGGTPAYAFSAVDERVTFTGAASTTAIYLLQRLESRDTNRLKGKTVTFSCEISNSLLTSVIWEVFRPTTTDDAHGTIATPTQTLIASGTFTVNSTLTRYSATFVLPDLASRGLEIRLRVGAQTSGTWTVARLQLEEGSVATDFNCGDYTSELRKCQRYFLYIPFNVLFTAPIASSAQSVWQPFSTEMFFPPIVSALTADPSETQQAANNSSNSFARISKKGADMQLGSSISGVSYVLGYRSPASSHIP